MSKDTKESAPAAPRITLVAFAHPVSFCGLSDVETWRLDKHGPSARGPEHVQTTIEIQGAFLIIRHVGERPPNWRELGARWLRCRVPLTSVRNILDDGE